MISFEPCREEVTLQETIHRVAVDKIRPALRAAEENGLADRLEQELNELGLSLMALPASVGGAESGLRAIVVVEEELAWGDPGIAAALPRPGLAGYVLSALDDGVQQRWLTAFVTGSARAAAAWHGVSGKPPFRARRTADGLVIDGASDLVLGQGAADWILVSAELDGAAALIVVERGAAGYSFAADQHPLGLRTAPFGRLELKECATAESALVATGAAAERALREGVLRELGVWSAWTIGTSRAAFEYAARYATERQTFGRAIAEHQAVGFMIADMGIEVEAARGLLWQAAWALDTGAADASRLIRSAAVYAADAGVRATTDAVQVLGGHGYIQDHPVEKWMRDARTIGNLIACLGSSVPEVELAS